MSIPEESNLIRKMMQKISPPISCTQDAVKQGENCPVDAGILTPKICCWYCEYLSECFRDWNLRHDYRCKKYHILKWCSAVWQAYRKREEGK